MKRTKKILMFLLAAMMLFCLQPSGITVTATGVTAADGDDTKADGHVASLTLADGTTTYYTTFANAIAAAVEDSIVTLLEDASGDGISIGNATQKNFTIDFGGYTYTVNTNQLAGSSGTQSQCFQLLKEAGSITMKNGAIVAGYSDIQMMIQNYCNLTLDSMILDATQGNNNVGYVLSNNNGSTTITGNTTITAKSGKVAFDVFYWPENGYGDVTVTINSSDVTINGNIEYGAYNNASTDVADHATLKFEAGTLNGGFCVLNNDGKATITVGDTASIASYGNIYAVDDNAAYTSLQAAINAAGTTPTTITLQGNVDEDITIVSGQNITLDLNGYTITSVSDHTITNYGTLTITDSSSNGTGTVDCVTNEKGALVNYGTATLLGGTYTRSLEDSSSNTWYTVKNYGTMTIGQADGTATVDINNRGTNSSCLANGYYDSADLAAAQSYTGNITPTVTIYDGTTISGGINTIKNDDYGELIVNGGTFENSYQLVLMNHSTATINGGTFTATGTADTIYNHGCDATSDKGILSISEGTFTSTNNYVVKFASSANTADVTITGGTFDNTNTGTVFAYSTDYTDNVAISGGYYSEIVPDSLCATGCDPVTTVNAVGYYAVCNHASATYVDAKNATCIANGNMGYWYCAVCNRYFSDSGYNTEITQADTVIAATGHAYGEPTFSWSDDGKTCTATFVCANCGDIQTIVTTITSAVKTEPTTTAKGVTTYTATAVFNNKEYTDTKDVADIAMLADTTNTDNSTTETDDTEETEETVVTTEDVVTAEAVTAASTASSPQTGDSANLNLFLVLGAVCEAALIVMIALEERKRRKRI